MDEFEPHTLGEGGLTDRQQQILYLTEEFPDWETTDVATCVDTDPSYVSQKKRQHSDLEVPSEVKPRIQSQLLSGLEERIESPAEPVDELQEYHDKISSLNHSSE